jgi:cobalt/nickel transport protein
MPDRKRRIRILLLHAVLLPTLLYVYSFFTLAPRPWVGVDETVVEKIAREHGREAKPPLVNTDRGDLLLFIFLAAGAAGGFIAGYCWRRLKEPGTGTRRDHDDT